MALLLFSLLLLVDILLLHPILLPTPVLVLGSRLRQSEPRLQVQAQTRLSLGQARLVQAEIRLVLALARLGSEARQGSESRQLVHKPWLPVGRRWLLVPVAGLLLPGYSPRLLYPPPVLQVPYRRRQR